MVNPSTRFVVFLCFIVLYQDLVTATRHHNEYLVDAERGTEKDKSIKEGETCNPSLEDVSEKEPGTVNSEAFKTDLCDEKNTGKSPEEIAKNANMDVSHVKKVLEKCRERKDYFYPAQIHFICQMKSFCDTPSEIAKDFEEDYGRPISVEKVKSMSCPAQEKNPECPSLYD